MTTQEARELIESAVVGPDGRVPGGVWADLGAGSGTFTFALAGILGEGRQVVAVDREEAAVRSLRRRLKAGPSPDGSAQEGGVADILTATADFTDPAAPSVLGDEALGGVLFANALHFDPDAGRTLRMWGDRLAPHGRIVVVEYEDRPPNPWVPHPLPTRSLEEVARSSDLGAPTVVGERPSSYGGVLYCAWLSAG